MSELIQYQRDDGIVTLTLNSPETRNPISDDDMIEALPAASTTPARPRPGSTTNRASSAFRWRSRSWKCR